MRERIHLFSIHEETHGLDGFKFRERLHDGGYHIALGHRVGELHVVRDPGQKRHGDRGLRDAGGIDLAAARTWVGVGGTATSLSAIVQELPTYDRARVHGSVLGRPTLAALATRLLAMPVAEVLEIPTMVPGRADVICAGALICARVAARVGADLTVSESDILDGIVTRLLAAAP